MLGTGDKVRLIDDYKQLREGSCYKQREFYAKLAAPDREYIVEFVTPLKEVYLK